MLHWSPWQHQASAAMCLTTAMQHNLYYNIITLFSICSDILPLKLALWLISSLDRFSSANSFDTLIARMTVRPLSDSEKWV